MIYRQRFPFPYEILAWSPQGEITQVGAPMETILRACRVYAEARGYEQHYGRGDSLDWSPDGAALVSCSSDDSALHVWDPFTGLLGVSLPLAVYYTKPGPHAFIVRWSPDGAYVAAGCVDGTIQLFSTETWSHVRTIWAHTTSVRCLAWSPDSTLLASGGYERYGRSSQVKIWSPSSLLAGAEEQAVNPSSE